MAETPMDEGGKFVFLKELGRGSFGAVVLARNTKSGEQVAIKKMERAHLQVRRDAPRN
jgi:serine/threonine protein kinase